MNELVNHPHIFDDAIFVAARQDCLNDPYWNRSVRNEKKVKADRCLHYLMRHQPHHSEY